MSVKIRLAKFGKKHAPTYRVVVAHTRTKRNGKYLDILGFYNPKLEKTPFVYDKDKLKKWQAKGAILTESVEELIAGNYKYIEYNPKKQSENKTDVEDSTATSGQQIE